MVTDKTLGAILSIYVVLVKKYSISVQVTLKFGICVITGDIKDGWSENLQWLFLFDLQYKGQEAWF